LTTLGPVYAKNISRQDQQDSQDLFLYFSHPGRKRENMIWVQQKRAKLA